MRKTIYFAVVSLAAVSAASNSNDSPQVGFFDSEDTLKKLQDREPNSVLSEVNSFTIETDVSNDLTVWSSDDVEQLTRQSETA